MSGDRVSFTFNQNPYTCTGNSIEAPTDAEVRNTLGLFRASIEDALKYGGELAREAISRMNFRNDRKHITVDAKVHMLMPKFYPAIPGWHTDGVPRKIGARGDLNVDYGDPHIGEQTTGAMRPHRYHLLVTGNGCLTRFVNEPVSLDVDAQPHAGLYSDISRQVSKLKRDGTITTSAAPSCEVVEFDWWNLHSAPQATAREWRYLIRAVESDHYEPKSDLRDVIRTQAQVYAPLDVSW